MTAHPTASIGTNWHESTATIPATQLAKPWLFRRHGRYYLRLRPRNQRLGVYSVALRTSSRSVAVSVTKTITQALNHFHLNNPEATWPELRARLVVIAEDCLADRLIQKRSQKTRSKTTPTTPERSPCERRGRPAVRVANPFTSVFGPTTTWGRYPEFAMDIVEGVARLDWHDRQEGSAEASRPLSVRTLMRLLESIEEITVATVADSTGFSQRHARRYVKALQLIMPRLLAACPHHLIEELETPETQEGGQFIYFGRMYIESTYMRIAKGEPQGRFAYLRLASRGRWDSFSRTDRAPCGRRQRAQ